MTDLRTAAQRLLEAIDRALPEAPLCSAFDVVSDTADDLRTALAHPEDKSQAAFEHWVETVEATQKPDQPIIQPEIKVDKETRWLPMPWKGLTEEEHNYYKALGFVGVKAVEEKLRAKNSTLVPKN